MSPCRVLTSRARRAFTTMQHIQQNAPAQAQNAAGHKKIDTAGTAGARLLLRESIYEAAEHACRYLTCLRAHIAADDGPGVAYSYRKFAAHGRVVAAGCKELISQGGAS